MSVKDILSSLIKFKTTPSNPLEIESCFSYIKNYINSINNSSSILTSEIVINEKKSILFSNTPTMSLDVLEVCHIDVVPADSEEMFIPKIDDKNIMKARGSADMKSGVAAAIKLFEYVIENKFPIKYGLLIVSDEETGGFNGSYYWSKEKNLKASIILDADASKNLNTIIHKVKGCCFILLKSSGKTCHGSTPWEGIDANESLINTLYKLRQYYPYISLRDKLDNEWFTTMHYGIIRGGESDNTVSGEAIAVVDFRFIETDSNESIMNNVIKCCDENVKASFQEKGFLVFNEENNKYLQMYKNIVTKLTGKNTVLTHSNSASDSRYFTGDNAVIIANQPDCGDLHASNEWVDLNKLNLFLEIRKEFINELVNKLKNK